MLSAISSLEDLLADWPSRDVGIGHNDPPEPIEQPVVIEADKSAIEDALQILKEQPQDPADGGASTRAAIIALKKIREKVVDALGRYGETFLNEAAKEAGKNFGNGERACF